MDLIIQSEYYHELLGDRGAAQREEARDVEQDAAEAGFAEEKVY